MIYHKSKPLHKIRVLHCLETVGSGGVEQTRLTLAKNLNSDRYEQRLLCTQTFGPLPDKIEQHNMPIQTVGVFRNIYDPERYHNAYRLMREFKPHIVHGAVYEGVALACIAGRFARTPIIIAEETSDAWGRSWSGHALYRTLTALAHHVIAVSPAVASYLRQTIHVPARKLSTINNGVQWSPPRQASILEARERFDIKEENFVIGTVGRLSDKHKRQSDLLHAFVQVRVKCKNAKLLIVGGGRDETTLRALSSHLGVSDHVVFTGYQPDPRPFYALMDIFAMPSAYEAFGLVLVEAMFAGLPTIATNVGGIPFVVQNEETGLLVERHNPEALANAIIELYKNPSRRKIMGEKGRRRALTEFSAERYVSDVDQLYQDLARNKLRG